jgi:transcriptional regulator with XRE-family HTH domain
MGGIERGEHNLTVQTALTVATGLGIPLSKLFTGIEDLVQAQSGQPKP